jgi:hypothetical protein
MKKRYSQYLSPFICRRNREMDELRSRLSVFDVSMTAGS